LEDRLKRGPYGFHLFLDDGRVDIDSNLVENAIRSPAINCCNALFAGQDEGGRNWAQFASLIGTCKMNGVEHYAYLRDLFIKMANGHRACNTALRFTPLQPRKREINRSEPPHPEHGR
jgi:hypothetical protein